MSYFYEHSDCDVMLVFGMSVGCLVYVVFASLFKTLKVVCGKRINIKH